MFSIGGDLTELLLELLGPTSSVFFFFSLRMRVTADFESLGDYINIFELEILSMRVDK